MAVVAPEDSILVMGHSRNTVNKSQVGKEPRKFVASTLNSANGKMVARMKWFATSEVWDMWKTTFFDASNTPLQATTSGSPKEVSAKSVSVPTEGLGEPSECHVSIPQPRTECPRAETTTESPLPEEASNGGYQYWA